MSGNIAVIYTGDLAEVADALAEAAGHLSARVRVLTVAGGENENGTPSSAVPGDLEWADGIAFGTPVGDGAPAPALMQFIESSEPLWSSGKLYDKAVTVFTDEPEHFAPDSVLHPIYDALYRWGAVIIGPREFELEPDARAGGLQADSGSHLPAPRLRSIQYRAVRLARLAGVLAAEHARRARVEL